MNKIIIFDVDHTLVHGAKAEKYYLNHYLPTLENTLAEALAVPFKEGKKIADDFRKRYDGRGELALKKYGLSDRAWYDKVCSLDPASYLDKLPQVRKVLTQFKKQDWLLAAVSDSPTAHVLKALQAIGVDPKVFDLIIGWQRGMPRPKNGSSLVYKKILERFRVKPVNAYMVGDSLNDDVLAAEHVGLTGIYVSRKRIPRHRFRIFSLKELPGLIAGEGKDKLK